MVADKSAFERLDLVREEWSSRHAMLVSRAQRIAERSEVVRCRTGTVSLRGGPGSAAHRSALMRFTLHRIRDTRA
jgi:hypothetical protein